jgi:hypothetical protein
MDKAADDELRECIINATLEYLVDEPDMAKYFVGPAL